MVNTTTHWTSEMVECLRDGLARSMTSSQLAAELTHKFKITFTRNSIIGKCHRLGIPMVKTVKPKPVVVPKPVEKNQPVKKIIADKKVEPEETDLLFPIQKIKHNFKNPKALSVDLLELKEGQCRYPLGDVYPNNDIRFCAAPVDYKKSHSYCDHCYDIVYYPARLHRKNSAARTTTSR